MAATAASGLHIATAKPCISHRIVKVRAAMFGLAPIRAIWSDLACASHISSIKPLQRHFTSTSAKFDKVIINAMSESSESKHASGLPIGLKGKRAFIAGVAVTMAMVGQLQSLLQQLLLKFLLAHGSLLADGSLMAISKIYPLDAVYGNPEDVPEDVRTNKRYAGSSNWTVQEAAESVEQDFGRIDILVHSLANGPEVTKPLLETSRKGYLAAISASSYSYVSLIKHFIPIMKPDMAVA